MSQISCYKVKDDSFNSLVHSKSVPFLCASAMLKHVIHVDIGWTSVRPSVRHTLVLYQNG